MVGKNVLEIALRLLQSRSCDPGKQA